MGEAIIQTRDLTVYYGKHRGIEDVSLTVERGEVFGFLGSNGAGKTTTLRVLLDIIRPTSGSASIFGMDCQQQGVAIRKRVGYLPGELSVYENMNGAGYLDLLASLHTHHVDSTYRKELYERLDFNPTRRIKEYSKGNKQKVGIIAAFMGKPDLIILDEPTGGLDPLIQQTVMELVREAKNDGRTVFFSSHVLSEVQAVCERVGIIRDGQLIKIERVETMMRQQFKRVNLTLAQTVPENAFAFEGVDITHRDGQTVQLEVRDNLQQVMEQAVQYGITDLETPPVTLEEIFLEYYGHQNGAKHD